MEGLGRFAALILMLIILIWIPLVQKTERQKMMMENMASEYLYELDITVKRRGEFTKEEFERYSYILFLMQGLKETEMKNINTEIGRRESGK